MRKKILIILIIILAANVCFSENDENQKEISFSQNLFTYLWQSKCTDKIDEYRLIFEGGPTISVLEFQPRIPTVHTLRIFTLNVFPIILKDLIISIDKNHIWGINKNSGEILWKRKYCKENHLFNIRSIVYDEDYIVWGNTLFETKTGNDIFQLKEKNHFIRKFKHPIAVILTPKNLLGVNVVSGKVVWEKKRKYLPRFLVNNNLICHGKEWKNILFLPLIPIYKIVNIDINSGDIIWEYKYDDYNKNPLVEKVQNKEDLFNKEHRPNLSGPWEIIGKAQNKVLINKTYKTIALDSDSGKIIWAHIGRLNKIDKNDKSILIMDNEIFIINTNTGETEKTIPLKNILKGREISDWGTFYPIYLWNNFLVCRTININSYKSLTELIDLEKKKVILQKETKRLFFEGNHQVYKIYNGLGFHLSSNNELEVIDLLNSKQIGKITILDEKDEIQKFIINNDYLFIITKKGNLFALKFLENKYSGYRD